MRARALAVGLALMACSRVAAPAEPPAATATTDPRLVLAANGSTLTGGTGGGGAAATWLANISPAVIGAGAEYQQIANAHWTTGNFTGSLALGPGASATHLYGEAHEGAGDIGAHAFHYSLLVAGVLVGVTPRLFLRLEERRIDIDTSHGNLPKLGLAFRVTPRLLASVSYADSLGGNLGTRLATGRVDYSGTHFSAIAGVAGGPAAPAVLDLLGQVVRPGPSLREGYLGLGKRLGRTEWLALADYQDVGGTRRTTITLTCTVHLSGRPRP